MISAEIAYKLNNVDVVSFDIFDTLLIRPFLRPNDVFLYIETFVLKEHNISLPFFTFRTAAESQARDLSLKKEVSLQDIYEQFKNIAGLDDKTIELLMNIEEQTEYDLFQARPLGKEIYNEAVKAGKEIIYISDMYLSEETIKRFLGKFSYDTSLKLYLSANEDAVKHDGSLFEKIAPQYAGKSVVHIGDNFNSDFNRPKNVGWDSIHIPRSAGTFFGSEVNKKTWLSTINRKTYHSSAHRLAVSSYLACSAHTIYDTPPYTSSERSHFEGNAYNLGYYAFGPMIMNFILWLISEAKHDKIDTLLFLSRDGLILKKAYDLLAPYIKDSPKSEYLLSSRRAYSLASLTDKEQLLNSINVGFQKTSVENILVNRYGLSKKTIRAKKLRGLGLGFDSELCCINNRAQLIELVMAFSQEIINNAAKERKNLLNYFSASQVSTDNVTATVDIGYSGTLQKYLNHLTGKKIGAYYMISFLPCAELINDGYKIRGYFSHLEDRHDRSHSWTKNLDMYEALFSSNTGSLMYFEEKVKGALTPVFSSIQDCEKERNLMLRDIQDGALKYCEEMVGYFGSNVQSLVLSPAQSLKTYSDFIEQPKFKDILLYQGVGFEDAYSGQEARYLIAPLGSDLSVSKWIQGRAILANPANKSKVKPTAVAAASKTKKPSPVVKKQPALTKHPVSGIKVSDVSKKQSKFSRKFNKFKKSPYRFFADSKIPFVSRFATRTILLVRTIGK